MIYDNIYLYIFFIASLSIALLTETTSWLVRSYSKKECNGVFIAKTNIYLYCARIFLLIYTAGLSYLVDNNIELVEILLLVSMSYILASLLHILLLGHYVQHKICSFIIKILLINNNGVRNINNINYENKVAQKNLIANTTISAFFFSLAMAAPYATASLLPDLRMTLGAIGQIINSAGTIILLLLVDPILYKLMDLGVLMENLKGYLIGRILGFMIGGFFLFTMGLFLL